MKSTALRDPHVNTGLLTGAGEGNSKLETSFTGAVRQIGLGSAEFGVAGVATAEANLEIIVSDIVIPRDAVEAERRLRPAAVEAWAWSIEVEGGGALIGVVAVDGVWSQDLLARSFRQCPSLLGRQFVQGFPAFTQAQPLQEPLLLHLQQTIIPSHEPLRSTPALNGEGWWWQECNG